jgi:hypothetical protein
MLQTRLVLAKFSNHDPLAVDHFTRWAKHHESVYASDDPSKANPGLSGDHFGLDTSYEAYKWPYVSYQTNGEDIDHVIITLEVYMTAYRLSLIDRETVTRLFRAVETLYNTNFSDNHDRIFEFGESYKGFKLLAGTANWLSEGTQLQEHFAAFIDNIRSTGGFHIREYESILAYYGSEELSKFSAP